MLMILKDQIISILKIYSEEEQVYKDAILP